MKKSKTNALNNHVNASHKNANAVLKSLKAECNGKTFKTQQQLLVNNQKKHINETCQLCHQTFPASKIYSHKFGKNSIHNSSKCQFCKKKFNYVENEFEHYATNHRNCYVCKRKFESFNDVEECQQLHKIIDFISNQTCKREYIEMIPTTYFAHNVNNLLEMSKESNEFIVKRCIVSSLTGNISTSKYVSAKEIKILSPYVIVEMDDVGTVSMIEEIVPTLNKYIRPKYYFEYETDLTDGLHKIKSIPFKGHDISHLATSSFARDQYDQICRNMKINVTMNHSQLNRVTTRNLERHIWERTKHVSKTIRQVVLIHETESIQRSDHPMGNPAFVLNILQYVREDEKYELRMYLFPNAPICRPFKDFEITERQREILFPHMKILNEVTIRDEIFVNKKFHMKTEAITQSSITLEKWKEIIQMNREELETSTYYTNKEIVPDRKLEKEEMERQKYLRN